MKRKLGLILLGVFPSTAIAADADVTLLECVHESPAIFPVYFRVEQGAVEYFWDNGQGLKSKDYCAAGLSASSRQRRLNGHLKLASPPNFQQSILRQ